MTVDPGYAIARRIHGGMYSFNNAGGNNAPFDYGGASRTWGVPGNVTDPNRMAGSLPLSGQMQDVQEAAAATQAQTKQTWNATDALLAFAGQAFAASHNAKELGQNLVQAGGQFLSQMAQQMIPGGFGSLVGGIIQYGFNMLTADNKLPVRDDAVDVRVINFPDRGPDYTGIRDRSEQRFARTQRNRFDQWSMAGAAGRAG